MLLVMSSKSAEKKLAWLQSKVANLKQPVPAKGYDLHIVEEHAEAQRLARREANAWQQRRLQERQEKEAAAAAIIAINTPSEVSAHDDVASSAKDQKRKVATREEIQAQKAAEENAKIKQASETNIFILN